MKQLRAIVTAFFVWGCGPFLPSSHIRIFDYPRFAEPLRDRIRENAEQLAAAHGVRIEYIAKAHTREEDVVTAMVRTRGDHPGMVHIISAMEACTTRPVIRLSCGPPRECTCISISISSIPTSD